MSDLKRIEDKLDKVSDNIVEIQVTLGKQHEVLKDHVRRSTMLEDQMRPIQAHVNMVHGILKFIGVLSLLASIVEAVSILVKK